MYAEDTRLDMGQMYWCLESDFEQFISSLMIGVVDAFMIEFVTSFCWQC